MSLKKRFCVLALALLLCAVFLPFSSVSAAAAGTCQSESVPGGSPAQSGYVFRPKVCSVYMEEVFGETMCETWFHLVDAVIAGEDTFACPDQYTYDWVMGQFPRLCFPLLPELIDYAWDRGNCVKNGVASFTYLVPRGEASARIAEFARQVEGILNEVLRDDDSDFEKVLALYDYFSRHYWYDWETYEKHKVAYLDYTTPMRVFRNGTGICCEIAPAYSYLLMQAGVEATVVMGGDHEWSFVRIDGQNYHVDPTYVLSSSGSLSWLMMTDEQRETDGFEKDQFIFVSNYSQDHPHPDYTADDGACAQLWDCRLEEFLPEENTLRCLRDLEGQEPEIFDFIYEE